MGRDRSENRSSVLRNIRRAGTHDQHELDCFFKYHGCDLLLSRKRRDREELYPYGYADEILEIRPEVDQVDIKGKAILFESGIYAKIPTDMPEKLALSALDVAGAPAQTAKLCQYGQTVLILGAGGKSGMLCCYEAKKRVGVTGKVIGIANSPKSTQRIKDLGFCDVVESAAGMTPVQVYELIEKLTDGKMADVTINCVNVPDQEMTAVLCTKDDGIVYFFSMATSFTKASLGAEGIGSDVNMIMGNGYTKGHAEFTLQELRESPELRKIFEELYA